jgi:hypothetical protein
VVILGAVGYNFKGPLHVVHAATVDWKYCNDEIVCCRFLDSADRAFGDFNWVFMQDNARPHVCNAMMEAFTNLAAQVLTNWPPYGPDLNIIETIWAIMRRRVEARQPKTLDALIAVLFEVWEDLSVSTINGLLAQMPDPINVPGPIPFISLGTTIPLLGAKLVGCPIFKRVQIYLGSIWNGEPRCVSSRSKG